MTRTATVRQVDWLEACPLVVRLIALRHQTAEKQDGEHWSIRKVPFV